MVAVTFFYDEPSRKWEVVVEGCCSADEARQAFNAVVITTRDVVTGMEHGCTQKEHGNYEIRPFVC